MFVLWLYLAVVNFAIEYFLGSHNYGKSITASYWLGVGFICLYINGYCKG